MDEASKMNLMVQKLLTLNQLEFGNDVVTMERFDITALIPNVIQSAEILTRQNGIRVQMEENSRSRSGGTNSRSKRWLQIIFPMRSTTAAEKKYYYNAGAEERTGANERI